MEQQRFVRKNMAIYEAQRRQEKKRNRRTAFYIFLFLFVSLVFLAVCVAVFLNVEKVSVEGNEKYSDKEILKLVPIETGDNMFSFDSDDIEMAILNKYPYVGTVEVRRDFPTAVVVNIIEEKPYFSAEIAGETYLLSSNLKVLEKLPDEESPSEELIKLSLNNVRRCIVGETLEFVDSRTFDAIIELETYLKENYIENQIVEIDVRSRFDIYLNYADRFEVYLGDMENADVKVRFLVGIIGELEDGSTGVIDISNPQEASVALS